VGRVASVEDMMEDWFEFSARLSVLFNCNFLFFQNVSISQKERECYMDLRPFMNPSPYTVNEVGHCILNFPRSKCGVAISIEEDMFFCCWDQLQQRRECITRVKSRLSSGSFSCPVQERGLKILQTRALCRVVFNWVSSNQNQSEQSGQSQRTQTIQGANQNLK